MSSRPHIDSPAPGKSENHSHGAMQHGGGWVGLLARNLQVPPLHKKSQFDFFVYYSSD